MVLAPASAGDVRASVTEPAGLSAISLTSRVVRTSLMCPPRDWMIMLAGPLKWRKSCGKLVKFCNCDSKFKLTLSPQMVLRPQVLNVKAALRVNLHTVDSLMVFQKRVLGSKFVGLGIWNRSRLALNL